MSRNDSAHTELIEVDLAVIGAGGAGLAVAVAAAEKGLSKICILEKRHTTGGNSVFPDSFFALQSGLPKRSRPNDVRNKLIKEVLDYAHWKINPRIFRALLDKSEDIIGWLEGKGIEVETDELKSPNQIYFTARVKDSPLCTGAAIVKALVESCQDFGINILSQTRATKLITGENGAVSGVMAESGEKKVRIQSKGVVIATGGFAGNIAMMNKYFPYYRDSEMHLIGLPHQGDGMQMAAQVGAVADGMVVPEMAGPDFSGSLPLRITIKQPYTLWVNNKGERFADETAALKFPEGANTLYHQPGKISYCLLDETIRQIIFRQELDANYKRALEKRGLAERNWAGLYDKDFQAQINKGMAKVSDSWDEMAGWIGAAPEILEATINEYNSTCDQAYDDTFLKDPKYLVPLRTPPYYAIRCRLMLIVTHGGIVVNHRMQVLDKQHDPIPGLFAAGVDTGGRDSDTYNFNIRGHSFGFSLNSGRIAGEYAAQYINSYQNHHSNHT